MKLLTHVYAGTFTYTKAIGVRSVGVESVSKTFDPETIIAIASCTKLLTAIAVLQCVEDGLFTLDEDISRLLPDLAVLPIISSSTNPMTNQHILTPRQNPIRLRYLTPQLPISPPHQLTYSVHATLRHLLTHSSGLSYEQLSPVLLAWRTSRNESAWSGRTVETRANHPLLFEPGTAWMYGPGTDWAGKLIERTTGHSLEDYMSSRIWGPLGLKDVTFWPRTKEHLQGRMAEMSTWDKDRKCVSLGEDFDLNNAPTDCLGGGGLFATPRDFLAIMQATLRRDQRLLKKRESWEELFRPQLTLKSKEALQRLLESGEGLNAELGANVPLGGAKSWALGGLVSLDKYDGWMEEGTLLWSGLPNIRWVSL